MASSTRLARLLDQHPTLADAVRLVLAGELSTALREHEEAERLRAEVAASSPAWQVWTDSAARRDGLVVCKIGPYAPMLLVEPIPFVVEFPPEAGSAKPITILHAKDVAEAMAEVDRRFPLPAWWLSVRDLPDARNPSLWLRRE